MDNFNNALSRSQQRKDDEGRSLPFIERLATDASSFITDTTPGHTLPLSELSPIEKDVYGAWWDELDPFGLGIVVDEVMHPFLQASRLPAETLERIIDCYSGESRYTEDQFYAILRLVAHGQSGRKINRDLVVLGAPLAKFDQKEMDALFHQGNNDNYNSNSKDRLQPSITQATGEHSVNDTWKERKDTHGATLFLTSEQQSSSTPSYRHSYSGLQIPGTTDTETRTCSAASSLSPYHQPKPFDWAEHALSISVTHGQQLQPKSIIAPHTTTITSTKVSHSRSRSDPYASYDKPSATATPAAQDHPRQTLISSRSSMDTADFYRLQQQQSGIEYGQSLLLTQKFTPPTSTTKSTNPFEESDDDDDGDKVEIPKEEGDMLTASDPFVITNQRQQRTDKSPSDNITTSSVAAPAVIPTSSNDTILTSSSITIGNITPSSPSTAFLNVTPTLIDVDIASASSSPTTNQQPNRNDIAAPTVPQSTKSACQSLRRSQSQRCSQKHSFMSQGAFLLATSSSSSSVKFPVAPPTTTKPSDDSNRLFRHRSITSLPQK